MDARSADGPAQRLRAGRAATPPPPNPGGKTLADMTGVRPRTTAVQAPALTVATIASAEVHAAIEQLYMTVPLYPDSLVTTVDATRPEFIVIERAALYTGTWFGAEREEGGRLVDELGRLGKWSRKRGCRLILVDSTHPEAFYTAYIRELAHHVFPSSGFWDELPERPKRRKLFHLAQKFGQQAFGEMDPVNEK